MSSHKILNSFNASKVAVALFLVMLLGRLVFAWYGYFFETDDIFIATGVAGLVNDNIGDTYRYGPQFGYYRLIQLICMVLGSKVSLIPSIMITLSAFAGAAIPFLGFFIFRKELNLVERMLLSFFMYINPVLWTSSRYGNVAIVALLFCTASIVILTNKPQTRTEYLALVLFGLSILIRADSILLSPIVAWLMYTNHRSVLRVVLIGFVGGLVLIGVYGVALAIDPRMDNVYSTVTTHLFNPRFPTMFWDYFLWSFSIFPLIFASMGLQNLIIERNRIIGYIVVWCVPVCVFYYASLTTPRYFLLIVLPICLLSVIGITRLASVLVKRYRPAFVWPMLVFLSSLHLFIGLGHFTPDSVINILQNAYVVTHDGRMFTGGFIYHGGMIHEMLKSRSFTLKKFGYNDKWFAFLEKEFKNEELLSGRERKIIVLLDSGPSLQFHFHAQVAKAEYISRSPSRPELAYTTKTLLRIGNATFMTTVSWIEEFERMEHLDVAKGDEFWEIGNSTIDKITGKIPIGLSLVPIQSSTTGIRKYQFVPKAKLSSEQELNGQNAVSPGKSE